MTNEEYWTNKHDRGPKTTPVRRVAPIESVSDLIAALQCFPGDAPVAMFDPDLVINVARSEDDGIVYLGLDVKE